MIYIYQRSAFTFSNEIVHYADDDSKLEELSKMCHLQVYNFNTVFQNKLSIYKIICSYEFVETSQKGQFFPCISLIEGDFL